MTKKHFIAMAIKFAQVRQTICNSDWDVDQKAQQLLGTTQAIQGFCQVAKEANSNFDADYFIDFIDDIVAGKRDANGKVIKTRKAA